MLWDLWILCEDGRLVLIKKKITYQEFVATCNQWSLKNVRPFISFSE
jgi:hypothetical protein